MVQLPPNYTFEGETAEIKDLLEELERELLKHSVRVSGRVAELLSDDFVEFGSSGRVYDKAKILAVLASEIESTTIIEAIDFKVTRLEEKTALVTYRTCKGADRNVGALRSSIWQCQAGKWQMIFHQGTRFDADSEAAL